MLVSILKQFGIIVSDNNIHPFGNGLINSTWKVTSPDGDWLLQKINQHIFRRPADIMDNFKNLSSYLQKQHPEYLFVAALNAQDGNNFVIEAGEYYRLFPFIENSYSIDTVISPAQAFEAARQFGKFTRQFQGMDPSRLHITLADFHNLTLRYQQFISSVENGNAARISECAESISWLKEQVNITELYEEIKSNPQFRLRVIHHDTKINNVLFDRTTHQGRCVIDLDTVMPGYYISDVGDMLRTYISPVNEDDTRYDEIEIREAYFAEIAKGYLSEMQVELSPEERALFVYAGKFAIYMQAIRFMTDYLNNDSYYSIEYKTHNLVRANNQITLLKRFQEKESRLNEILQQLRIPG